MKKSEWVCCFCRQDIHTDYIDPCFLDLRTSRDPKEVQELTCHAECLNKVIDAQYSLPLLTQI